MRSLLLHHTASSTSPSLTTISCTARAAAALLLFSCQEERVGARLGPPLETAEVGKSCGYFSPCPSSYPHSSSSNLQRLLAQSRFQSSPSCSHVCCRGTVVTVDQERSGKHNSFSRPPQTSSTALHPRCRRPPPAGSLPGRFPLPLLPLSVGTKTTAVRRRSRDQRPQYVPALFEI